MQNLRLQVFALPGGPSDCGAPTDGDDPDVFIDEDDDLIEPRAMSLLVQMSAGARPAGSPCP